MLQGYAVLPPDCFKIIDDLEKLRARSRLPLPTQFNDLSEISRPWVIVRNVWSPVLLCGRVVMN